MSTTKLWISDKMELRYSPTGWPKQPIKTDFFEYCHPTGNKTVYVGGDNGYEKAVEKYKAGLAKAKKESVPLENQLQMRWLLSGLSPEADAIYVHRAFEERFTPDTFIEFAGEVDVIYQVEGYGKWIDVPKEDYESTDEDYRKVARLKPVNSAHSFTEAMSETEMNAHLDALENKPPHGMKARILEAFCREYDGESMAYAMLIKVLDELNIK